ncbi:MAG: hypothetical protein LC623_08215 [Halobacteriales archaeon]|nr:hypothetical protein [Halobacteriales archaeon]
MGNLEKLIIFAIGERVIVTISSQAKISITGVTPCEGPLDWLTGCGDTVNSLIASMVVGTIDGAGTLVNVVILGVLLNALLIVALFKWGRGVPDV